MVVNVLTSLYVRLLRDVLDGGEGGAEDGSFTMALGGWVIESKSSKSHCSTHKGDKGEGASRFNQNKRRNHWNDLKWQDFAWKIYSRNRIQSTQQSDPSYFVVSKRQNFVLETKHKNPPFCASTRHWLLLEDGDEGSGRLVMSLGPSVLIKWALWSKTTLPVWKAFLSHMISRSCLGASPWKRSLKSFWIWSRENKLS